MMVMVTKKKQARKIKGAVIIPPNIKPCPATHEIRVAEILAGLGKTVLFANPYTAYKAKSFDVVIDGINWEIKSPQGNSKSTVVRQLKRGKKQSNHIIFDTSRTSIGDHEIEKRIRKNLIGSHSIKRVIMITKKQVVIDICK